MRKHLWTLTIPLILILVFTGCSIVSSATEEESEAPARRLDPAAWPTPQPTEVSASPTPFPKITLPPAATPTSLPATLSSESSYTPVQSLKFTGNIAELVQQVTELSGGFPPVAAAAVNSDAVTVRQEPAESAASVGIAEEGELAAILGRNESGDWLYTLTRSGFQGWLPVTSVDITFTLKEPPVLPPDPLANESTRLAQTTANADPLAGLEPAAVALVTAKNVSVRQGPGATYPMAGTVEQGELAGILGVNAARDWLYIITISGTQGWLPADTMRVTGSLAGARVLPANPLAFNAIPATPAVLSELTDSSVNATASQPLVPGNLTPVTEARVNNQALNLRQGPGAAYQVLSTLSQNDQVTILAINKTEDWALVKTTDGQYGWASLAYLAVDGSIIDAPRVISPAPDRDLPAGQVAPAFPASIERSDKSAATATASIQSNVNTPQTAPASVSSPATVGFDLSPKTTARASRAEVKLYRAPGTNYEPIVTLSPDESVSILALNQEGNWALVKPTDFYKSPGWVLLADLATEDEVANAPHVITAWVDSNELAVRRGPGIFDEQIGTLAIHDLVAVLGVNQNRDWALVQPVMGGGLGWISPNFLTLADSWSEVPVAPVSGLEMAGTPLAAPVPTSAMSSRPGKIVFQTSSGGDIMVVNPDGTGLRRLTHGIDPVLSADGQTVAFTRWAGETGTLWLIDVSGANERAVLGETRQAKHPSWSPDGQQIVVNFQHEGRLDPKQVCENLIELGDKNPNIPWNVDPDSVEVKIKDRTPYLCWELPPDPHWGLRVVNLTNGRYEDMPSDAYAFGPEWDPVNAWRVVSSGLQGLVQLDVNRREDWVLTTQREDHTPAFSPDGRYIAVAFNNNGQYDIHRLNSDGSGRVPLTKTPLWVTAQPGEQKPWNNVSPAWSPDGSRIAFLTDRTGRWEIWAMNVDGSNQRPMFPEDVNDQLSITYNFVDERVISWR